MSREPHFPMMPLKHRPPLYEVLQQKIKNYIIQNSLKPGDRLPSETELAQQLGVSRNSVREAVKALEMLDIVETRSGAGLFVGDFYQAERADWYTVATASTLIKVNLDCHISGCS